MTQHHGQAISQQRENPGGGSLELKTLVITAAAALVAAIVTQTLLGKGALIGSALTPVIIALVREGLNRPATKISEKASRVTIAPRRGAEAIAEAAHSGRAGPARAAGARLPETGRREPVGAGVGAGGDAGVPGAGGAGGSLAPPPPFDDTRSYEPTSALAGDDQDGGDSAATTATAPAVAAGRPSERTVYGSRRRFRLKHALLTAAAGFLIAVTVLTVSELALGGSVAGGGERTTLFGGGAGDADGGSDSDSGGSAPSGGSDPAGSESSEPSGGSEPAPEETAPAPEEEAPAEPAPAPEPAPTAPPPSSSAEPPSG